jgi:hypothetical protein
MIAVVAVSGGVIAAGWAWWYQQHALRLLDREIGPPQPAPTRSSVLAWDGFWVISVLAVDGAAIVACRRQMDRRRGWDNLRPADETIVLRIGDDERAGRALSLLERWRAERTRLTLRPASVEGAIELFDGCASALRAPVVAA